MLNSLLCISTGGNNSANTVIYKGINKCILKDEISTQVTKLLWLPQFIIETAATNCMGIKRSYLGLSG